MTNLKKAIIIIIMLIIAVLMMSVSSFAAKTATVIEEDIKLRKNPDNSSTVLELIPKKEEIEVLEEQGEWTKVVYMQIKGYVRTTQIKLKDTNTTSSNTIGNTIEEPTKDPEETPTQQPTVESNNIENGDIVTVNKEEKIYIRPLLNAMVIETVAPKTDISIMQQINGWAYIGTETTNGWIRVEKLSAKTQNTIPAVKNEEQEESTPEPKKSTKVGYISTDEVNFRKEANTTASILKVLSKNTKVTVIQQQEQWCKVEYDGKTGYISKEFISDKKIETTSRGQEVRQEEKQAATANAFTKGQEIVEYAKQFLGYSYVYGGATPSKGFDCSGFTKYVFNHFGIELTHSATAQSKVGMKVEKADLQPGDIVFFSDYKTYKGIGHCGIYIGDNMFIHASTETTGVITSSLVKGSYVKRYVTATRLI